MSQVDLDNAAVTSPVDLSQPDNSEYEKGRSRFIWALWHFIGSPVLHSNILPFSSLKCSVLRLFGARIGKGAYLKPGLRVKFPWYLTIGDHCWIGEDVWIDNLANVDIASHVCISQGAYLCTGNHDWRTRNMKLFRRPIVIQEGCWVGARAIVCPGTTLGRCSILTVGSVVTRNIPDYEVWAGNPASFVRHRVIETD